MVLKGTWQIAHPSTRPGPGLLGHQAQTLGSVHALRDIFAGYFVETWFLGI